MIPVARWIAVAGIVLAAGAFRTCSLGRKPMHADEANQAVRAGELLESGVYRFDPRDHHGPTLYFAVLPVAWARGQCTLAALTESTVRLVPALFGTLSVALLGMSGGRRNRGIACLAAALLAVSPPAVYYSRYYIQETLLVAFSLLTLLAATRWWKTPGWPWAGATGAALGLMLATKETAAGLVLAAGIAACGARWRQVPRNDPAEPKGWSSPVVTRGLVVIGLIAVGTATLFYSALGRDPGGIWRAMVAPLAGLHHAVAAPAGHEKAWWYYAQLLTWKQSGGIIVEQVLFTVLALVGAGIAWVRRENRWALGATIYTVLLFLMLSLVPYKTPWNVVHLLPPMAFLAAYGLWAIAQLRTGRIVAGAFGFLVFATLMSQLRLLVFQRPTDERNPYAYVHSSPDVLKYRPLVGTALMANPTGIVRVISEEYWPLPWYLRGLPRVGYWTRPPRDCDGALVIVSADLASTVAARLHGTYRQSYLGLRPGFVCVVFTPLDSTGAAAAAERE